jgi:nucleoside-diphosphate-sugar epimerase
MKVLISGATGFIGGHLVAFLLKSGFKVAILKRANSNLKKIESYKDSIQIFISDTYNNIYSAIKHFNPAVVIHLATLYINHHKPENISDLIRSNITFGTHILEAIAENGGGYFLNVGTRWQHIGNRRYAPANLYAATKEAFKCMIKYYETKNILHKTIELCDTFGQDDNRKKIVDLLISACYNKTPVDLTPGEQILDFSFVDDICEFIIASIKNVNFFDNGTISLCGTIIKLSDLGEMIENKFNTSDLLRWGVRPYRENEVMKPPIYYHKIQLKDNSLEKYIDSVLLKYLKKESPPQNGGALNPLYE